MKVERRDGSVERRILIGLIVDKRVLSRISAIWDSGLFRSKHSNLIGKWCVDYWDRYEKAPKKAIQAKFESWASDSKDENTIKLVEDFLESLSGEYEALRKESNSEYLIDLAQEHFNSVRAEKLADTIKGDLESGNTKKALSRVDQFSRVEIAASAGIDVFRNEDAVRDAFEKKSEPLITYPDPLDHFFDGVWERDAFVSFLGPEKRGKSFWLHDIAWRGIKQRRKVAFFEAGDMSQSQVMIRFMERAAKHPHRLEGGFPGIVRYPKSIKKDRDDPIAKVRWRKKKFKISLDWRKAWDACQRVVEASKTTDTLLKLACYPNSTINMRDVRSTLQSWEREGWTPDVIVIDYADILAPLPGTNEYRHQINDTWKAMRSLSQSLHCLLVTATQADAASYRAELLTRSNFSDDKRKLGHVTAMIGINQTIEEKEQGIMRLNKLALREGDYSETRVIYVAGCLDISNPAVKSCF